MWQAAKTQWTREILLIEHGWYLVMLMTCGIAAASVAWTSTTTMIITLTTNVEQQSQNTSDAEVTGMVTPKSTAEGAAC